MPSETPDGAGGFKHTLKGDGKEHPVPDQERSWARLVGDEKGGSRPVLSQAGEKDLPMESASTPRTLFTQSENEPHNHEIRYQYPHGPTGAQSAHVGWKIDRC